MNSTVDGEYQRYKAENGAFVREHFFGKDARARALVDHMTDEEIWDLRRGGLDPRKIHAAYRAASELKDAPTVILAKTIKGWTLGPDVEGRNATHQIKELTNRQLLDLRRTLHLEDEIPEEALDGESDPPYYRPPADSPEYQYMMDSRKRLFGSVPSRTRRVRKSMTLPTPDDFAEVYAGSGKVEASTTTAFTRLLRNLARAEQFGSRVVPIVPDEARTFGMDSLFRELKIYASRGQLYEPVDAAMLLAYVEGQDGQILEEGITEAGSTASWIAAATSYATRGVPMAPFYIYYSMFGWQRVGDLLWSAADAGARGFLLGATAGHTAGRRTPAPGWSQPHPGLRGAELRGIRPCVRLRIGRGDRRRHPAYVWPRGCQRLLLRHALQREPRPAPQAG
jgi:pyruvate dehydrogenase E1 component